MREDFGVLIITHQRIDGLQLGQALNFIGVIIQHLFGGFLPDGFGQLPGDCFGMAQHGRYCRAGFFQQVFQRFLFQWNGIIAQLVKTDVIGQVFALGVDTCNEALSLSNP